MNQRKRTVFKIVVGLCTVLYAIHHMMSKNFVSVSLSGQITAVDECDYLPVHNKHNKYVSLCDSRMFTNRNGNGNHLFYLAAVVYVAERTGRDVMLMPNWCLDEIFQLDCLPRYNSTNSTTVLPGPYYVFDKRNMSADNRFTDKREDGKTTIEMISERTILLCGPYHTAIYADNCNATLRKLLQFRPEVREAADEFIRSVRSSALLQSSYNVTVVGVHVRRGDFLIEDLPVIDETYLQKAMAYYIARHRQLQFVFVSSDQDWVEETIHRLYPSSKRSASDLSASSRTILINETLSVVQSLYNSAAFDMAILTMCDSLIISTGSFGWWAAWIANKPTVYYNNWPGPRLDSVYDRQAYFPKSWVPMI